MGQSVAQVCLMSTIILWLSLPYHYCYCCSILFLERRVMRQTEGLFDVYSWLLFSDHNSHSSFDHFKLLLLSYDDLYPYFSSTIIINYYDEYPTTIPLLPGTIISPYCPISCAGALPLSMCSFMNHLFRSINGIFSGHESDHCLALSVTELVSLAVLSLSVVQFYEPFVQKPKYRRASWYIWIYVAI